MVKRLFSLLVALAIAGAPVALEACQIACASPIHPMAPHNTHQAHHQHATAADGSCHAAPAATHQLSAQTLPCDHDGDATIPSVTAAGTSNAVSLDAAAVPLIPDVVLAAASAFVPKRHLMLPDRVAIRLATPLRI